MLQTKEALKLQKVVYRFSKFKSSLKEKWKMWIKKLSICLWLYLVIQSIQCAIKEVTIKNNAFIIFKNNNTVQVNGIKFSELNCTSKSSFNKLCSNITEVTCLKRNESTISSCLVTNKNSTFF